MVGFLRSRSVADRDKMESDNQDKELGRLILLRESYRHKAFLMMFEILVIFGLPALLGFFLADYLAARYALPKIVEVLILLPFFILSWVILIFRYKIVDRELKDVNKKIQEIKNKQTS